MRHPPSTIVLEPRPGWRELGLSELGAYHELFFFLVWREIKSRYAQSILGVGWAVVQPVMSMMVFTVIFGGLARIDSDGVPYALFSFTGLVPWTYFSNALSDSTGSLVKDRSMLEKIYFPRLVLPLSAVLARLLDLVIALAILGILMVWYGVAPTPRVLILPILVLVLMASAGGLGMFLGALSVQYRDVKHAMTFGIQLLMYAAPVVYPVSYVPEQYRLAYALNPVVGVVEGFRTALLGTGPIPWDLIAVGSSSAALTFVIGAAYFRRRERVFADVI
jgi:lipopolysaccharide transport system permease protein